MSAVSAPPSAAPGLRRPGLTLAVIVACQLMIGIDTSIVTIALPDVQDGLGISTTGLSWVQNSYMLAFGGLLLLGGRAGDLFGRRRVFSAGLLLFAVASLLGGLASAPWTLLAARTLQGVGAAIAGPSALALLATSFSGPARIRALSIFSAVTGAGAAIGMVTGGLLTDLLSWRAVFFVTVPVGVAVAIAAPRVLPETERRPGRFDVPGALIVTAGMTALVYGFIRAADGGWGDVRTVSAFAAGLALLALLVLVESRAAQPVMPLRVFRDRDRSAAYLAMLLAVAGLFGSFYFLTLFLQDVLEFGPIEAGFAFLPMVLAQFTVVRTAPRLLPRLGARVLVGTGLVLLTAGLLWLTRISAESGYAAALLGPMILMGGGGGLAIMPLNATVLARATPEDSGAVSGIAQTMLWCGASLGTAVMVSVHGTSADDLVSGMPEAFAVGACFAAAAALVAVAVLRAGGEG